MAAIKRRDGETREEYRERLQRIEEAEKERLKPKVVWESTVEGTYRKKKHGELG